MKFKLLLGADKENNEIVQSRPRKLFYISFSTFLLLLNAKQEVCERHFLNLGTTQKGIELRFTDCRADTLLTASGMVWLVAQPRQPATNQIHARNVLIAAMMQSCNAFQGGMNVAVYH